jgi:hypothetical protein
MNFRLLGRNITKTTTNRAPLSRIVSVTLMTAIMFFVLVASSPSLGCSLNNLRHQHRG